MDDLGPLVLAFLTLLLIPALGVANMTRKRLTPLLSLVVAAWGAVGAWVLISSRPVVLGIARPRFFKLWVAGLILGFGFLLVARLRERRKTWRWIKLALAAATLAAFARALWVYLHTYA
ncbi:MAG TPA: hypothetical protein VES36_01465 [Candidatus Limnocylindrales bacterium]|nr:hypothetical protein [Candidatus Limnocylindrales bacterium]